MVSTRLRGMGTVDGGFNGHLRRLIVPFALSVVLFSGSLLVGYHTTDVSAFTPEDDATRHLEREEPIQLITNNGFVLGLILLGAATLGITTFVNLSVNGLVLGNLIAISNAVGLTPIEISLLVVPHGVFEITAFLLGGAIGFRGPIAIIGYLRGDTEYFVTPGELQSILLISLTALALIVVAAIAEAWLTPWAFEHYVQLGP